MTTQYVSVQMQCLPSVWKAWNLELVVGEAFFFLICFIYYHLLLASVGILKDSRKKVLST